MRPGSDRGDDMPVGGYADGAAGRRAEAAS